ISEPTKIIVYSYEKGKILWENEKIEKIPFRLNPLDVRFILIEYDILQKEGKKIEIERKNRKRKKKKVISSQK
ncbi:MAG: hypothetical protein ACP5OB_08005, partial [Candidatus Ratteibacteria bacterium]